MQVVTQLGWQQFKLQQAKRNADQAERAAQILQQQAWDAKNEADRAQENARSLGVQSDQAQSTAARARQGLAAISSAATMQIQLMSVADQAIQRQQNVPPGAQVQNKASPVLNTQGQATGKIISTTD